MNFVHESLEIIGDIKRKNVSGKRLYETPDGNFPSITTVLSSLSKASIQEWRNKVGAEEANRISTQASRIGTKTHKIIEDYLQNQQDYLSGHIVQGHVRTSKADGDGAREMAADKYTGAERVRVARAEP